MTDMGVPKEGKDFKQSTIVVTSRELTQSPSGISPRNSTQTIGPKPNTSSSRMPYAAGEAESLKEAASGLTNLNSKLSQSGNISDRQSAADMHGLTRAPHDSNSKRPESAYRKSTSPGSSRTSWDSSTSKYIGYQKVLRLSGTADYADASSTGGHTPNRSYGTMHKIGSELHSIQSAQAAVAVMFGVCEYVRKFSIGYSYLLEQVKRVSGPEGPAPIPLSRDSIDYTKAINELEYSKVVLAQLRDASPSADPHPPAARYEPASVNANANIATYNIEPEPYVSPHIPATAPQPLTSYHFAVNPMPMVDGDGSHAVQQSSVHIQPVPLQHAFSHVSHHQPSSAYHHQQISSYSSGAEGFTLAQNKPHSHPLSHMTPPLVAQQWTGSSPGHHFHSLPPQPYPTSAPFYANVPVQPFIGRTPVNHSQLPPLSHSLPSNSIPYTYNTTKTAAIEPLPARPKKPEGEVRQCFQCKTTKTPEWRRGPDGSRTLCNACGLQFAKQEKKRKKLTRNS